MKHRHSVLLVEDDADCRSALTAALALDGVDVTPAVGGQRALDTLRDGLRPCAILLDLHMPDMTGADFRRSQVGDPALADLPVALLSADDAAREHAVALGVGHCLSKPTDPTRVLAVVEELCRVRSTR